MFEFINIGIIDVIDIVAVALGMYYIYKMTRGTVAINIILGVVFIFVVWIATKALNMELVSSLLGGVINVGVIALFILFQPELRQFLQNLGRTQHRNNLLRKIFGGSEQVVTYDNSQLLNAVTDMSESKTGALIVLTQESDLSLIIDTGIVVDAQLSTPLLENLFFKNSPLHDGALIVQNNRLMAASCILPVSHELNIPKKLGLRHRAALGISQETDAIAIIVSEETGAISVARNGKFKLGLTAQQLESILVR